MRNLSAGSRPSVDWKTPAAVCAAVMILGLMAWFSKQERTVVQSTAPASTPVSAWPVESLTAESLASAYRDNEVSADRAYKGKLLAVTGTIQSVGKDAASNMYLALAGAQFFAVKCMFDDQYEDRLARLSRGQTVRVVGTVRGKAGNVILRDCEVP